MSNIAIQQEITSGQRDILTGLVSPTDIRTRIKTYGTELTVPENTGLGSVRDQRVSNRID